MSEIKFDKRNYRKHNERNKELINKSLKELGAGRSILLDRDDSLIAGNGVYEQAEKLGIPVRVIETDGSELIAVKRTDIGEYDEKRKRLALADNATSDSSEWDVDAITADLSPVEVEEWDIHLPGFMNEVSPEDYGEDFELPSGDKEPFQQMAFVLSDEQADRVKTALADAMHLEEYKYQETFGNTNRNANALYFIINAWMEARGC